MKFFKTVFIASFLFITIESSSQSIEFQDYKSWEQVVSDAKKNDKAIFVDVYTDWCTYCKKLDKEVFNVESVASFYNKNFISVKIDAEDEGFGTEFAKKHEIRGYPTLVYFNSKGDWVHRISGYRNAENLINAGWDATNEEKQLVTQQSKFKKGETNLGFLANYLKAIDEAGIDNTDAIQSYVSQLSDIDFIDEKHWEIVSYHFNDADSKHFSRIIGLKKALEKKHSTAAVNKYFLNVYSYKIASVVKEEDPQKLEEFKIRVRGEVPELAEKLTAYAEYKFYKNEENSHSYARKYLSLHCSNANELNAAAWKYFENVDDESMLNDALFWSVKSVRLDENWFNTDTQANLLFKLGQLDEAKRVAERSIDVAVGDGMDPEETRLLLDKINNSLESR